MTGCCDEPDCKRKKPMKLARGGLTGTWYIVTDYEDRGNGSYRMKTRHRLTAEQSAQLDEAFGSEAS